MEQMVNMGTLLRAFMDNIKITIIESIKFIIVTVFLFFLIATPLAYLSIYINADPNIAGPIIGIIFAVTVFVVDYKKLHCFRKIKESKENFAKEMFKNEG